MTDDINKKINHHEWRLDQHDKSIEKMEIRQEHIVKTLDSLLSVTKTIKAVAITVAVMIVASEIGLFEVIKKFI